MTRVISISDDAYDSLAQLKKNKDSFSKVILRLTKNAKKVSLLEFAGKWKGDKKETDKILRDLVQERGKAKLRKVGI
jgi:predicted CopG family antitoxin